MLMFVVIIDCNFRKSLGVEKKSVFLQPKADMA